MLLPLAVICMVILHHAGHEAVHGSFSRPGSRAINDLIGWVAYGTLGQNFILMRWSHMTHHRFGRLKKEYTIDRSEASQNKIQYYICLLGGSNIYHELAGYLYILIGKNRAHILTRRFRPSYYLNLRYVSGQIVVLLLNMTLWIFGGWKFGLCKVAFTLYWGATQNIAHYGLEVGRFPGSRHAARTYRIPKLLNFLVYGAGPYHLEHHLFPRIPGLRLSSQAVTRGTNALSQFPSSTRRGGWQYLMDCFAQYRGPISEIF